LTVRLSRTCGSSLGLRSAATGRVWLAAQRRALRMLSGQLGSSRRAVLNAHRFSAARRSLSSGFPRVLVNIAVVTAVSASAWVRLVVAATRGHFRSAKAQAMPLLARSMETGRPVLVSKASPLRAAASRSDRKLSASAAVLKVLFHRCLATFQRTT
jgi:hypothetical protein